MRRVFRVKPLRSPPANPICLIMNAPRHDFHTQMERFEERLPDRFARWSCWLRQPKARLIRIPAALLLILGGIFSVLPVFGLWMLPLGLLLLAVDLPLLRPPLTRMLRWIERKWPRPGANPPPAKRKADR